VAARPAVAVVVPFAGDAAGAREAAGRLAALAVRSGDELVLADNSRDGLPPVDAATGIRFVRCPVVHSAYAARNEGARRTSAPWLLFVDADCRLPGDLLDRSVDPVPPAHVGAVAGAVHGAPDQPGLVPAYIRSRRHLDQAELQAHPYRPMAVTANLLVRRSAWEALGGFAEDTESGADADFCWRLGDLGLSLGLNLSAAVEHEHRATLRALLAQARRDGRGAAWLAARHRGYSPVLPAGYFVRAAAGTIGWPLLGRPRRGAFKALDGIWGAAFNLGARGPRGASRAGRSPRGRRRTS
jgi:glycosyltransferase involved in cell wall biosynthesis